MKRKIRWSSCCLPAVPENAMKMKCQETDETVTLSMEEVPPRSQSRALEVHSQAPSGPMQDSTSDLSVAPDCFPEDDCYLCDKKARPPYFWTLVRRIALRAAQSEIMEFLVLLLVILGCLPLIFRDVSYVQELGGLARFFHVIEILVPCLFMVEMSYKILGYGCWYFLRSGWRTAELVIVLVVFFNMLTVQDNNGTAYRILQSLQVLRLLRVLRYFLYFDTFRDLMNLFLACIPGLASTMMLAAALWLVFANLAMSALSGRFHYCVDQSGGRAHYTNVANKEACLAKNLTWISPPLSYDNIFHTAFSFFHVGTFNGWIGIMRYGVDTREIDEQPADEASLHKYINFLLFVVQMAFWFYTLLFAVLLDAYNRSKTAREGGNRDGRGERIFKRIMSYADGKEPEIGPKSNAPFRVVLHDIASNGKFDWLVAGCAIFGIVLMSSWSLHNTEAVKYILHNTYIALVVLLFIEVLIRILGSPSHLDFLRHGANVVDLLVLILSIYDLSSQRFVSTHLLPPLLLRTVRLVQMVSSHSWFRHFRGLRHIRMTLSRSLPAILFLYIFVAVFVLVYAIGGLAVISASTTRSPSRNQVFNFRTIGSSLGLMFQIATTVGWDKALQDFREELGCTTANDPHDWSCGRAAYGPIFLISFVIFTYIIVTTVLVVLIQKHQEVCEDLYLDAAPDDVDDFYKHLRKYQPPEGPGYIPYKDISSFLHTLPSSFRIPKPNSAEIALMDLPIYSGHYLHHLDILECLVLRKIEACGLVIGSEEVFCSANSEVAVSSTLWRAHETACARKIESAWRNYKRNYSGGEMCCSCAHQYQGNTESSQLQID